MAHVGQPVDQAQLSRIHSTSYLTRLISFDDKLTFLVDEGKAVDIACLDFHKAFDTIPHIILLEKQATHVLDRCSLLSRKQDRCLRPEWW